MSAPKIPDSPEWDIVRETFRKRRLNPDNPEHWLILLKAQAEEIQSRVPDKQWTDERLIELAADFSRVQHDHPGKSGADICRILAKRGGYGGATAETLRRRLQDARNPGKNEILNRLIDMVLEDFDVEGGNARERLRKHLTVGFTHYWEDENGNLHSTPPEPPPPNAPLDWPGRQAIRLIPKKS